MCGAYSFEIACQNEKVIRCFEFIDNHFWIKILLGVFTNLILSGLTMLAILKQKIFYREQWLIFVPYIISMSIISWYNIKISTILNFGLYLIPIAYNKKKWYRSIFGLLLVILFQFLSLKIKNISGYNLNDEPILVTMIMQIDTFILVFLYYLYSSYTIERRE